MITPETLLTLDPLTALKSMISEQWPGSDPSWFVIDGLSGRIGEQNQTVDVVLSNLHVPFEVRSKYNTSFKYTLSKIDAGLLNNKGPIELKISPIKSKPSLIEALESHFLSRGAIKFDKTDFENPDLDLIDGILDLDISLGSYRWYGQLQIKVDTIREMINAYTPRIDCIMDHGNVFSIATVKSKIVNSLNLQNVGLLPVLLSNDWCSINPDTMMPIGNESDELNTQVTLNFNSIESPYQGTLQIKYGRRSFYKTYSYPVTIPGNVTTPADITDLLNLKLDARLDSSELTFPIDRPDGRYPLDVDSIAHLGNIWVIYE